MTDMLFSKAPKPNAIWPQNHPEIILRRSRQPTNPSLGGSAQTVAANLLLAPPPTPPPSLFTNLQGL